MPRDPERYRERMRIYMLDRYKRRTQEAKERLGGKCVECGATEQLEFDHIDRTTKSFTVGRQIVSCSQERFEAEIVKCQLLCKPCHIAKTKRDLGQPPEPLHGTTTRYTHWKCKCEICRTARNARSREYMRKRRASSQTGTAPNF